MDWSNEAYVRLYKRDTKTWILLGWEGQALLGLIMRKMDRSGVMDDVTDAPDVAVMLGNGMPVDVIAIGLERLLRFEVLTITESGLLMSNFIEAQEATKSDPQRQREARERKRARSRNVTDESRNVTDVNGNRSFESQVVTTGHDRSQPVTLCCADPVLCSTKEEEEISPPPSATRPKPRDPLGDQLNGTQPGQRPEVVQVHELWKSTFGKTGAKLGNPNGALAILIRDAVRDYGLEDCLAVVRQAPSDAMVTGKDDEHGKKHDDLFYILGQRTFDRLLVASKKAAAPPHRQLSVLEQIAAQKAKGS